MGIMNRLHVAGNIYQGTNRKLLCVCSAGVLRSPTAAIVLANEPFNHNTRCAGIEEEYALIPVDEVLLHWCDEVVCMTSEHERFLRTKFPELSKPVKVLNIPDSFRYRDPRLCELIAANYSRLGV